MNLDDYRYGANFLPSNLKIVHLMTISNANNFFFEQRERMKKQLEKTKNQKEKLESLCRSLQAERKQSSSNQAEAVLLQD